MLASKLQYMATLVAKSAGPSSASWCSPCCHLSLTLVPSVMLSSLTLMVSLCSCPRSFLPNEMCIFRLVSSSAQQSHFSQSNLLHILCLLTAGFVANVGHWDLPMKRFSWSCSTPALRHTKHSIDAAV